MSAQNKIKLLLVDDEVNFLKSIASRLELQGFDVTTAFNGNEAIRSAEKGFFDVAVVDFKMPGMTWAELTKEVKSKPQYMNMPVLILSSEKAEQCKIDARNAGAYGWLNKPFDINRFLKIINSIFK